MEGLRERFGKYHVLERIAQGGMAEVYKVKTIGIAGFEKVQALKRILPHQAHQGRFIRSFIDEARIAVELNHRNIVQVFDFGKADGELYLAMELIEGTDLRTATTAAQARRLEIATPLASYIISEVAAGLDYAHRKSDGFGRLLGIVHCDVSPSNVMLSTDGYVKILDFGIARASFASALERRRLRGKPRYMAPEQTRGEAPTPATDVFALAIIAWELYAGRPLFTGADLKEILGAVRRADVPRLDRINPEVPPEVVSAIATALTVAPEGRGSAADIAGACGRAAAGVGARALAHWLHALGRDTPPVQPWHEEPSSLGGSVVSASNEVGTGTGRRGRSQAETTGQAARFAPRGITPTPPDASSVAEGTPGFDGPHLTMDGPPLEEATRAETPGARRGQRDPDATSATGPAKKFVPTTIPGVLPSRPGVVSPFFDRAPSELEPENDPALDPALDPEPPTERAEHDAFEPPWAPPPTPDPDASSLAHEDPIDWSGPRESAVEWEASGVGLSGSVSSDALDDAGADATRADPDMAPHPGGEAESVSVSVTAESVAGPIDDPIDDALADEPAPVAVERRRVVVVVAIVDAHELDVVRLISRGLGELAYQRGGVVLSLGERTIVVAFGLEVAGEDDLAIAMAWALDASAMARDAGAGATVRIGARTGVGAPLGREVTGDGPRVAADAIEEATALARDAQPDRPLFSGAAGRLSSSLFALREVPARRALGRRSRVTEVIGPRSFDERDRTRFERRGRFVGRNAALVALADGFERAVAEDRRITALVTGPVGSGKSRLVAELIGRITAAPRGEAGRPIVIATASAPASRLTPFSVVIDLYLAALGLPPARGRAARAQVVQRLLHVLGRAGLPSPRALTAARDLERAMELRDGLAVDAVDAADLSSRIAAGVDDLRMVMRQAARPGIIVLEDLHQGDGASLDALRLTLDRPAAGAELLVLTARAEGVPLPPADIAIELDDLVGAELRELVIDRLGEAASPFNVAAVIARAGGNPLFIEELARAVREAGDTLPATAREVVAARVDRLSPSAKGALRMAAVLGGAVRARLLEELVGAADLSAELDELCAEGFLVRADAAAPDADEGELAFARGLVREVVYEAMTHRAQREAHARIGRLLASRFFAGRDEPPAVIGEHLERGGDRRGAAAFWLRAGRLALAAGDAAAAAAHYTRTLELEKQLGDPPPTLPSRARRREAIAGREEAHRTLGDLTSDPDDLIKLAELTDGDPARLADVELRQAQRALRRGDLGAALAATDRAIAQADHSGPLGLRLRGEGLRLRAEALERQAKFEDALAAVRSARILFAQLGAFVDETRAMIGQGRINLARGQFESARDLFKPVLARIQRLGDPLLERTVAIHVAVIQLNLGSLGDALASAQRAVELCHRHADRAREGDAIAATALVYATIGRYDEAATGYQSALDLLERTGSRDAYAECLVHAGACDLRRGSHATAAEMISEGERLARSIGARPVAIHARSVRALAAIARGDVQAAVEHAAQAAAAARDARLHGHEMTSAARHARALAEVGAGREAADPARRALALLDLHRYPAGSVEEVLMGCAIAFDHAGERDRADTLRERGKQGVLRKLHELVDPAWKSAFEVIEENRYLLR